MGFVLSRGLGRGGGLFIAGGGVLLSIGGVRGRVLGCVSGLGSKFSNLPMLVMALLIRVCCWGMERGPSLLVSLLVLHLLFLGGGVILLGALLLSLGWVDILLGGS